MLETRPTRLQSDCFYNLAEMAEDVLFWETDVQLNFTYINPAVLDHTEFELDEIIGKKLNSVLHPEDQEQWDELMNSKDVMEFKCLKFKIKTRNGQTSYVTTTGKAIKREDVIIGYLGICTFETKDIIAEKVIKRLQNTNKTIINCLSEALIIVDKNERIIVLSPSFNNIWNFKKGDVHLNTTKETQDKMRSLLIQSQQHISLSFTQHLDNIAHSKDVLKFKDGRIIERKSSPYLYDNKIIGRCWSFKDITQQAVLIDKLGKLAFRDSLTKLYNRRWCEKKLKQLLKNQKSENVAFLYLDLDHFKVINDSCGHIHGDDVLEEISQLLLTTVGKKSYLSRLGGDEFGLIIDDKSERTVMEITDKIKATISAYSYRWKEKLFKIGVSIGVVFVKEEDDFRSVFIHADEACYLSKENGRNKATIYNAEKAEFKKTKTELEWYDAIQKALLNGKFELWCQPIVDPETDRQHYEILLRMQNEEGKIISPAKFMNSAERFGMLFTIDKRVVEDFCRFYQANIDALKNIDFSINISGHSLGREGFLPFVLNCMNKFNVNYHNICFEITENEIIKNIDMALMFIKEVRSLGCKISLDDFGKGLTSFSYLKNIPFDYIKIDGQFIKEINDNIVNEAVIKSIVYIAEIMQKKTIAEHIESEEALIQIKGLGVNYFQGYYYSQPHQITKLLK
jgi:diguanylate cyclase (GGDEF)-like protein/PAS domain S-box-containing protein